MTIKTLSKSMFFLSIATLIACGGRGGDGIPEANSDFVDTDDPDNFIQFLNPQSSIPAGSGYQLKVGTETANQTGSYTATITLSDGTPINCSGSWSGASNSDADNAGSTCTTFDMIVAGGAEIEISSSIATCIYIVDRNDEALLGKSNTGCNDTTSLSLPASRINYEEHGVAYYKVIDPNNTRTTLEEWRVANRFGQPCTDETLAKFSDCEMQVQFRDTKDLGYGRNMFVRREDDATGLSHLAIFVENFQVDAVPGLQYSALNYQSLIDNDRRWHFGTNAIEFSAYPYGAGEPSDSGSTTLFTKFYTFRADQTNFSAPEVRLDTVDLDARGFISMPGPCISCHGGKSRPLDLNGNLALPYPGGIQGDTQAQLNMIEVNTLGFPERTDAKSAEQEAGLQFLNQAIYDSYRRVQAQGGEWDPAVAMELLVNSYGGDNNADNIFDGTEYDSTYIPTGWRHDPIDNNPPLGAEALYLDVVKPHCITCHSKQGNINGGNNTQISFENYASFIEHGEQIERYVYDKGLMPLSLLNFDEFWDTISPDKAALLGSFIDGFSHSNGDGSVIEPGAPVALPSVAGAVYIDNETDAATAVSGSNFTSFTMSAAGSPFSTAYQWAIVSPTDSTASIENATAIRARFINGENGVDYVLRLTVSNDQNESDSQLFKVTVDNTLTNPIDLSFETDAAEIKTLIQTTLDCDSGGCHSNGTNFIPMYFTDSDQPVGTNVYEQTIQRINFADPLESRLLRRPSGYQHPGNCLTGFDIFPDATTNNCGISNDRTNYDLFLNWILEGAVK